jgi:hypothetical protein
VGHGVATCECLVARWAWSYADRVGKNWAFHLLGLNYFIRYTCNPRNLISSSNLNHFSIQIQFYFIIISFQNYCITQNSSLHCYIMINYFFGPNTLLLAQIQTIKKSSHSTNIYSKKICIISLEPSPCSTSSPINQRKPKTTP